MIKESDLRSVVNDVGSSPVIMNLLLQVLILDDDGALICSGDSIDLDIVCLDHGTRGDLISKDAPRLEVHRGEKG